MEKMPRYWGTQRPCPHGFGRGCGPYIKAFLAAQTAIRADGLGHRTGAFFAKASFSRPNVAGDAEMPQTAVH
jgi:hypothetical protein